MDLRIGSDVRSLRLGLDSIAGFVGFSTLAVLFLGLMTFAPQLVVPSPEPLDAPALRTIGALAVLVAFIVFHGAAQVIGRQAGVPLLICSTAGTCAVILLAILCETPDMSWWVVVLLYGLGCIGAAASGCLWFTQLCKHQGRTVLCFIAVGLAVGEIICLAAGFMAPMAAMAALGVCALVTLALLAFLIRESRADFECQIENKVSDKRSRIRPVSTIMLSISFFEFGFIVSLAVATDSLWGCLCASLFVCIILAIDAAADGIITERSLSPLNPPLTVMAFLLLFMFGQTAQFIALCVIAALSTIYIIFGWTAMVQHVRLSKLAPMRVYAKARITNYLGFAIGIACGVAAAILPIEYGACLGVIIAAVFCLLSFFAHKPRFPESGFSAKDDAVPQGPRATWEQRCHAVGEKYELSERQQEVLVLMAQGRNAKYIENALTISLSTVQTHIRNIYRKLGVHSRQELLDLIEATKLYGED